MSIVKNWNELVEAIDKSTQKTLETDVFDAVKEAYKNHIISDVYNTYSPAVYERRDGGGLGDDDNIVGNIVDNVLEVKNIAKPNHSITQPETPYSPSYDTQFAAWIERGETYNGQAKSIFSGDMTNEVWANIRPFTENTIIDLTINKQHVKAMKSGLEKQGIKIK